MLYLPALSFLDEATLATKTGFFARSVPCSSDPQWQQSSSYDHCTSPHGHLSSRVLEHALVLRTEEVTVADINGHQKGGPHLPLRLIFLSSAIESPCFSFPLISTKSTCRSYYNFASLSVKWETKYLLVSGRKRRSKSWCSVRRFQVKCTLYCILNQHQTVQMDISHWTIGPTVDTKRKVTSIWLNFDSPGDESTYITTWEHLVKPLTASIWLFMKLVTCCISFTKLNSANDR